MSKRSYPSGSEKRKKALHQKEVIEKLPKLTSYFTTTTGETSVSSNQLINVPHDESAQSQIAGISKPSCSNFEKEIESESDYSYDESATTLVTSLKPTTVSIELQFSNTEELISHADYFHEKFIEINREILIRKGPVYFQNKDSDFSEASRTYKDAHQQSMMTYLARSKAVGRVDMDLLSQHQKEVDYWRNVLKRIVAVVKFLASRGLPFRGDNEILGSPNNGNYLGCVELLSEKKIWESWKGDKFDNFKSSAKENPESDYKDLSQKNKT
ncbi:hypothetical protein EVAR_88235_1 [Eumeta japonica]|uniref:DUF4371 domain-containing protein n=1 Tax=Eumeta variegata TaxID=151549 RepID=A0A4C1Z3D6_EUMVA|nr:hypothetical protein EVAR_88235_1 [Eumeta japonica]